MIISKERQRVALDLNYPLTKRIFKGLENRSKIRSI